MALPRLLRYGPSYTMGKWRLWRRWWRYLERDLYRREIRRGFHFWCRPLWFLLLIGIVLLPRNVGSTIIFGFMINFILTCAWAYCLQNALDRLRGRQLDEILVTPRGVRRFFPALLVSPLMVWTLSAVVVNLLKFSMNLTFNWWKQTDPGMSLIFGDNFGLWASFQTAIFVVSNLAAMWMMAGVIALAGAASSGQSRSVGMIRSILISVAAYGGTRLLNTLFVKGFVVLVLSNRIASDQFPYYKFMIIQTLFLVFYSILIGWIAWQWGLRQLLSVRMIERLQAAAESSK